MNNKYQVYAGGLVGILLLTFALSSLPDSLNFFREEKSANYLIDYAEKNGFKIDKGLAGMPTAFTATYGEGSPVIGIIGEFDALPGLSQTTVPYKNELLEGGAGHGCGHNLFGTASLGAAVAIKELIDYFKIDAKAWSSTNSTFRWWYNINW